MPNDQHSHTRYGVGVKIYNTLSGKKEILKPLKGKKINLFVCGPTVYDFSHIGHARSYIIFDCFAKYLKKLGFKVFYLQNITDIDDKIIMRSREKGVFPKDLANAFLEKHLEDMESLGINSVNKYAKATDYIKQIIDQVERLMSKGYAYKLPDGIYYDIGKFKGYGKLSGRTALQAEDATSRIDYSKDKKNRGDFCLWKFNDQEDEPSWPSPFGKGRPGWHIEDTAITEKFFGAQYDIHGGGRDLLFPHHEAEIAQMEALSGKKPLANYWMHTGFLTTGGQKMSKSLTNFILISDFLARYTSHHLRFWVARNLWRSPMDYSESAMIEVRGSIERIEEFLFKIRGVQAHQKSSLQHQKIIKKATENFYKELADDFNTPKAFAVIFELIKEINPLLDRNELSKKDANTIFAFFKDINTIFDIIDFKKTHKSSIPPAVKQLIQEREKARTEHNWQRADELRKEIERHGFLIEDTAGGPLAKKMN